jgi:hypothetical protein
MSQVQFVKLYVTRGEDMVTNGIMRPNREAGLQEIEKLVTSHLLHNSESLCKLLKFLAQKGLDQPGVAVKEYEIATEVFHRPADFDPRLDSTVRVQTGRLRSKLSEYYAEEQSGRVIVEIPKGSYSLTFHLRNAASPAESPTEPTATVSSAVLALPAATPAQARQHSKRKPYQALALLGALIGLLAFVFTSRIHGKMPTAIVAFWQPFLGSSEAPLLIYSNAAFVGRPETGLRYYQKSDSNADIIDHYTGVGEVMGVHELDKLASGFNNSFRVHRGRLMSWDDALNSDIVFIGSPAENLSLREMPSPKEFIFQRLSDSSRVGDLGIQNLHPQAGEKQMYVAADSKPLADDYAVVELLPGLAPSHHILILAGITTFGTQAAVEFVCRPKKIEELVKLAGGAPSGALHPFEAVIHVQISGGVPVRTELVALHKH